MLRCGIPGQRQHPARSPARGADAC